MNKTEFIKELSEITNLNEDKCKIVNDILENIINQPKKRKFISPKDEISDEESDKPKKSPKKKKEG